MCIGLELRMSLSCGKNSEEAVLLGQNKQWREREAKRAGK